MTTELDRIYIRFKGRVLGPLTILKASELVKRGQITRQHELSPDGSVWKPASEFTNLFPEKAVGTKPGTKNNDDYKLQSDAVLPDSSTAPASAAQWYAHFDGSNQGPVDDLALKNWITTGKVTPDTLIWRQGMESWIAASLSRSDLFPSSNGSFNARNLSGGKSITSLESASEGGLSLGEFLIQSQRWVSFLAITGIVVGTVWMMSSIAWFFFVATRTGSGPSKVIEVVFSLLGVATSVAWFLGSVFLLNYANRVAVLRYRAETVDVQRAAQALGRFWTFAGIATLSWLVIIALFISMMYLLGLSIPF